MVMSRSEAGKLGAEKTNKLWKVRYYLNPKICCFCHKELPYEKRKNKFCDHSCAASKNNLGWVRNGKTKERKNCIVCSSKLNERSRLYCSHTCQQEDRWQKTRSIIETSGNANLGRSTAKRYIAERDGYKCKECDCFEWNGKRLSLILDHIDGNPYNWSVLNLRLLCPNCDSLTSTYKGRNKGNGRHSRRQRYREGKSY